jgi:outer membrane protein assembly factor BamB
MSASSYQWVEVKQDLMNEQKNSLGAGHDACCREGERNAYSLLMKRFSTRRWFVLCDLLLAGPVIAGVPIAAANSTEGAWPNWRGPNSNGSISGGEYPTKWDATNVAWKVSLPGKGSSTPIVWKERIYLTVPAEGQNAVVAFDFAGKQIWQTKLGPETPPQHRALGSSCNASPVTDGQGIFVYFKSDDFAALNLDGTIRWQTNLVQRFGREQLFWDQGTSPMLTDKDVVLARMHGGESWIAGFDKDTGALRWQQARNYNVPSENDNGYSTPLLYQEQGRDALLVWGADHLTAHAAADGQLLWSCDGFNPQGTENWPAIATPVIVGNLAIVPVGRDDRRQGRLYAVKLGGSGDVTETRRAWKRDDVGVFVCTPAEYKGKIHLLRHRGEIACIDPADGRTVWADALPRDKSSYFSSPIIANGVLYAAREDGVVFAARVEGKFELLSENPMGERIIASPVPVANHLVIRGDEHLFFVGKISAGPRHSRWSAGIWGACASQICRQDAGAPTDEGWRRSVTGIGFF